MLAASCAVLRVHLLLCSVSICYQAMYDVLCPVLQAVIYVLVFLGVTV